MQHAKSQHSYSSLKLTLNYAYVKQTLVEKGRDFSEKKKKGTKRCTALRAVSRGSSYPVFMNSVSSVFFAENWQMTALSSIS